MLPQLLAIASCIGVPSQPPLDALHAIRSALPPAGIVHLVYASDRVTGQFELWADPAAMTVLHISGTAAILRDAGGEYSRGFGADARTGAPGQWEPKDANHAQSAMNIPHPLAQAVLLLAEPDRITKTCLSRKAGCSAGRRRVTRCGGMTEPLLLRSKVRAR